MNSPILSLMTGEAARLIHKPTKLRAGDLSPKQLAWCRRVIPGFKRCEKVAEKARKEAEKSREKVMA